MIEPCRPVAIGRGPCSSLRRKPDVPLHPRAGLGIAIAAPSVVLGILVVFSSMVGRASMEARTPTGRAETMAAAHEGHRACTDQHQHDESPESEFHGPQHTVSHPAPARDRLHVMDGVGQMQVWAIAPGDLGLLKRLPELR